MNKQERREDRRRNPEAGFTLIEIMIVVAILGLLASLVAGNVPSVMHRNRVKIAKRNIEMLQNAVDMYYTELGRFPKNLDELVNAKDKDGVPLKLIKKVPKDPWDNDFEYVYPGQHGEDECLARDTGHGVRVTLPGAGRRQVALADGDPDASLELLEPDNRLLLIHVGYVVAFCE